MGERKATAGRWAIATVAALLAALPAMTHAQAAPTDSARPGAMRPQSPLCLMPHPLAGLCATPSQQSAAPSQQIAAPSAPTAPVGGPAWAIVPSPNLPGDLGNVLTSVACPAASDCWAAGYQMTTGSASPLIERWDGATWRIAAAPKPTSARSDQLNAVACANASDCWAGGYFTDPDGGSSPLAEHWDGSGWSLVAPPRPGDAISAGVEGIACAAASDCWAVGFEYASANFGTLIEHWNGTSWSIVPGPSPGNGDSSLAGVTCAAATVCWAAGSSTPGSSGVAQALLERWDGTAWSLSSAGAPPVPATAQLAGVACASPTSCWAVGRYAPCAAVGSSSCLGLGLTGSGTAKSQALIEEWTGGNSWIVDDPADASPLTEATLSGVACAAGGSCYAVGSQTPSGGSAEPLVDTESGGASWASASAPAPSGAESATLAGIACASVACSTVGSQVTASGEMALAEQVTGSSWNVGAPSRPQGSRDNFLNDVACASVNECFAVGADDAGGSMATLVERWDGGSWSLVPSPGVAGEASFLQSVTCVSASLCWAVGYAAKESGVPVYFGNVSPTELPSATTLIESWNGSAWSVVSSPNAAAAQISALSGVSCASADECFAVGDYWQAEDDGGCFGLNCTGPAGNAQNLIEQWNGSSWAVVSSPDTSPVQNNGLSAVTCVSASDCWAVGLAEGTQTYSGLVEQWNGSAWSAVASPQTTGNQSSGLFSIACAGASTCWAVGALVTPSGAGPPDVMTRVEGWNGTAWSTFASPSIDAEWWGPVNSLYGVSCARVSDCSAVGTYGNGPVYQTLALHWDGGGWNLADATNPPGLQQLASLLCVPNCGAFLYGVRCTADSGCLSAGTYNDADGTLQTLIEGNAGVPAPQVPEAPRPALLVAAVVAIIALVRTRSPLTRKRL